MHKVKQCKHGVVHEQCRCWDPKKTVEIVPCMTNKGNLVHQECKEK